MRARVRACARVQCCQRERTQRDGLEDRLFRPARKEERVWGGKGRACAVGGFEGCEGLRLGLCLQVLGIKTVGVCVCVLAVGCWGRRFRASQDRVCKE